MLKMMFSDYLTIKNGARHVVTSSFLKMGQMRMRMMK